MASYNDKETSGEFPKNGPLYQRAKPHQLEGADHFGPTSIWGPTGKIINTESEMRRHPLIRTANDAEYLIPGENHWVKDSNVQTWNSSGTDIPSEVDQSNIENGSPFYTKNGTKAMSFTGSTTQINQEKDPNKQAVMDYGLENAELKRVNNSSPSTNNGLDAATYHAEDGKLPPPLSPLQPYTRLVDPSIAQSLINCSYNRFQYPVADIEHRKAFRNVFFTRPECYIMCKDSNSPSGLAAQCELDDDIRSSFVRMPHISKMLSSVAIAGTFGSNFTYDNINYLLSNRVKTFSNSGEETLSTMDTNTKGIEGYTVTPGMHMESRQGGTIQVTFRDTKYLEIAEYIRLWMLYIWKRKRGFLEPPYAGYNYSNNFPKFGNLSNFQKAYLLHPYDRAIEYTCSLFDFVTNEANDRILYWCKWYGLYPIQMTISGISSGDNGNGPLTGEMTVEVTFKYQYKTVCSNKALIEFNFNAGLTNEVGHISDDTAKALNNSAAYMNDSQFISIKDDSNGSSKLHYIPYAGPAGMFVGTPYIVMGRYNKPPSINGPRNGFDFTIQPYLRFMIPQSKVVNFGGNIGLSERQNISSNSFRVVNTD